MASNKSVNQLVLEALQKFVCLDKKKDIHSRVSRPKQSIWPVVRRWILFDLEKNFERQIDQELWK